MPEVSQTATRFTGITLPAERCLATNTLVMAELKLNGCRVNNRVLFRNN